MADSEIDLRDFLLLGVLSVLWGGSFFFVGVIGKELPPMTIVLARVAIAALLLLSLSGICQTKLPLTGRSWFPFLVMGLLNNVVPFSMITIGQQEISSGLASVLNATTPLFTLLVMVAFGEEQLSLRKIIGILIGLTGVMMHVAEVIGGTPTNLFRAQSPANP
jgi:drug/metabolite transporter (DMT)-like permease